MIKEIKLRKSEFVLFSSKYIKPLDVITENHINDGIITDEERDFYNKNTSSSISKKNNLDDFFKYHSIENKIEYENYLILAGEENKLKQPQFISTRDKLAYLIHIVARNGYVNKDDEIKIPQIKLSSKILQDIIGKDYNLLINTLYKNRVLSGDRTVFIKGKSSRTYFINPEFYNQVFCEISSNKKVERYINKTNELLDKGYDNPLFHQYNKCLSKIKLINKDGALIYINSKIDKAITEQNEDGINHYKRLSNNYLYCIGDNYIKLIRDSNNRIYHILTNTNRDFRQFINIKFLIDICNSHPLLLNKLLLDYYNINDTIYDIINNISYNNMEWQYPLHNVSNKSLKGLINNIIKKGEFANLNLPKDVIHYIIMTSRGQFWHYLLERCKDQGLDMIEGVKMKKHELKKVMFAEVFYSNIHEVSFINRNKERIIKHYAKLFKKIYPNVFKIINHNKPKGNEKELSNNLMKLEAEIFYKILEKLYKKRGLDCINIHDAIIVLSTSNKKYKKEDIEKVMLNVYHSYSLFPTLDFKDYSLNNTD